MKKKIENIEEFKEEKRRVRNRIRVLESLIEEDINLLKEKIKPWNMVGHTAKNLLVSEQDGLVGETIGLTVSGLIRKVLLRRANWLVKFIVVYMLKNYAKNMVLQNSSNILEWVRKKVADMSSNHHDEEQEEWTAI